MLTINVTKVIHFSDTLKFNMALSDLFIPIFVVLSFFLWRQFGFKNVFKGYTIWVCLVSWLVFVAWIGILSEKIIDGGWMGLFEELIKTGLCIIYFFVGYNTLRVLNLNKLQVSWAIATLFFIVAGFAIYILAINGLYYWSDDPKYLGMFTGTDTDPNHAATFLTLSFFGMGIFAILSDKLRAKMFYYGMMSLSTVGLIFTGSRGGLIGFAIGIFVLLGYYAFKNWRVALAIILIMILMILIFLTLDQIYLESVFSQRLIYKLVNIESGIDIRANLSRVAWMMSLDHPLFGVGRGNFILNSSKYFEKLGIEVIENIPHNTYFGLIAETGFVGFILFLMPFLIFVYTLFKRYGKKYMILKEEAPMLFWVLAGVCALGVQAFVLNIENRRFLWFIAGVLIFIYENIDNLVAHPMKHFKRTHVSAGLLILFLVVSLSLNITTRIVHIPYQSKSVNQNYIYEVPFDEFKVDKQYEMGIKLSIVQNKDRTDRVLLKIVEESKEGSIKVLDSFTYKGASGVVVRTFIPTVNNSKIYLNVVKLDQTLSDFSVLPLYLQEDREYVIDLSKWYFLQPNSWEKVTIINNKQAYADWVTKSNLSLGLKSTFDKQLSLESVAVNQMDESNTVVSIRLTVLSDIKLFLTPFLYGYPNNLHVMDETRIAIGLEGFQLSEPVDTTSWKIGETHNLSFTIPRQYGIYSLKLGFYHLVNDKAVYLPVDNSITSKRNMLDLGSLNLDLYTEGNIYE